MRRLIFFISVFSILFAGTHFAWASNAIVDTQKKAVATNLGLFGGSPQDITVDPTDSNYVYVATYTPNGIFRSINGGETWSGLPADVNYGAGKAVEIDSETGDVYALISDNVLKSTDHGTTWSELDEAMGVPVLEEVLLFANDTLVVAVNNGVVSVSTDNGETFTEAIVEEGIGNNIISLAADSTGVFYAVMQYSTDDVGEKLYRSVDGGITWTDMEVTNGGVVSGSRFYGVAVDPEDTNHIVLTSYHPDYSSYHTLDGGTNWLELTNNGEHIGANEAVFDGNGRLYLGQYYTDNPRDATPVWTAITTTTPLSSVTADMYAIDSLNTAVLFTNTGMGVAKSEDAGTTWIDVIDGMTAVKTYAISQANNKDVVWIGAGGGLAKTTNFTDARPNWEYPVLPSSGISNVKAVWVQPDDADVVVAGLSTFLSKSTDGGETWTQSTAPQFSGQVQQIVPSVLDTEVLYAIYQNTSLIDGGTGGVLISTDAGSTWEDMELPNDLPASSIAVTQKNETDLLYVGIGSDADTTGIYVYSNGEWTQLDEDFNGLMINTVVVNPEDNEMVFATVEADSTEASLYKSIDAGETWQKITNGLDQVNHLDAIAFQPAEPSTMYMSGQHYSNMNGLIYKSTDAGENWNVQYTGLKQEFFYVLLFDGLVTGNDRGLYGIQSLGTVSVKATKKVKQYILRMTLRDAATQKRLGKRILTVYKKQQGKWKLVKKVNTNTQGRAQARISAGVAKKGSQLKIVWKPVKLDKEEYARSQSRIITVSK